MIDDIYKTAQAELNKDQLGYLKPLHFNSFIRKAQRKVYNKIFLDLKTHVRKMNWMLDGKDFANHSELLRQLLEFYSDEEPLITPFTLPSNLEFVADVFFGNTRVDKIHYSDFKDLKSNIYAKQSLCSPSCSKVGNKLKIAPDSITEVELHFIRKPKVPKWTFQEVLGKPMFNETAPDYQDVDMPETFFDELVSLVVESASQMLKDYQATQLENAEQTQDFQVENRQ